MHSKYIHFFKTMKKASGLFCVQKAIFTMGLGPGAGTGSPGIIAKDINIFDKCKCSWDGSMQEALLAGLVLMAAAVSCLSCLSHVSIGTGGAGLGCSSAYRSICNLGGRCWVLVRFLSMLCATCSISITQWTARIGVSFGCTSFLSQFCKTSSCAPYEASVSQKHIPALCSVCSHCKASRSGFSIFSCAEAQISALAFKSWMNFCRTLGISYKKGANIYQIIKTQCTIRSNFSGNLNQYTGINLKW